MANIYTNIRSAAKMKASPAKQTDDELNYKAVNDGKEYYTTHGGQRVKVNLLKASKFKTFLKVHNMHLSGLTSF